MTQEWQIWFIVDAFGSPLLFIRMHLMHLQKEVQMKSKYKHEKYLMQTFISKS